MNKRNAALDILRIIAFLFVLTAHSFLHTGFYSERVTGHVMYLSVLIRTLSMTCVPLFLMISGYLLSERVIEFGWDSTILFYSRIKRIIYVYVVCMVLIFLFQKIENTSMSCSNLVASILRYDYYSWYVEMYLGLYLLIPFLNTLWRVLKVDAARLLIFVLVFLSVVPTFCNMFDLSSINTLLRPWTREENYTLLIPDYWTGIYPIMYYYVGAYFRKYISVHKINAIRLIGCLIVLLILFTSFNIWKSYDGIFKWGCWQEWWGFENFANSVLIFLIVLKIFSEKESTKLLRLTSELTFGAFILSYILDVFIYRKINSLDIWNSKVIFIPFAVVCNAIISLLLSYIVNCSYDCIKDVLRRLKN
ncbi:acyltransferase [Pseudobutyrivibrio sp.]|uniref:acyltransferase n=1 Tax=Pseudobutyrivibrio sp. TaxID=2014367 RepID=UPI001E060420|nr:hypothetical protein [Pseudobutyrivibrio sp.]